MLVPHLLLTGGIELTQFFRARHAADGCMHGFEHANILDLRDLRQQPQPFPPEQPSQSNQSIRLGKHAQDVGINNDDRGDRSC